ncbi:MAG: N-acetylmuramoyl-L-alanine amidase [Hyphomicrobiaceae bacterium]
MILGLPLVCFAGNSWSQQADWAVGRAPAAAAGNVAPGFGTIETRPAAKPAQSRRAKTTATAAPPPPPRDNGAIPATAVLVKEARAKDMGEQTRFTMQLTKGVRVEVYTLANPYRVVIDMPDVGFALPDGTGRSGAGMVTAFRYGLFAERKARVVLDLASPAKIVSAAMSARPTPAEAVDLNIDLAPVSAAEFGGGTGVGLSGGDGPAPRAQPNDEPAAKRAATARPVILIDPGHGGIDPGALGASNLLEKNVVLDVALKIKRRLDNLGKYDVRLTRSTDVFVSLDSRVRMSREMGADLFVSLHADSIASKTYAPVVRGATIYTLSEQASDEQARAMAEKENASDLIAGIDTGASQDDSVVRNILIDLMKRETANFSADFSAILAANMKKSVALSREPQRGAAFKVLRQPHAPSVLIELGFMSNAADEALMRQTDWQSKVAQAISTAVERYFERRTARSP